RVLHVEDGSLLLSRRRLDPCAHLTQARLRALDCLRQTLQFCRDLCVRHDVVRNFRHLPQQEMRFADGNAGRGRNSVQIALRHSYSPKLDPMSATSASRAACSSGPSARTSNSEPCSAASIITPMILLPFTSVSSRMSVNSDLNLAAVFTI